MKRTLQITTVENSGEVWQLLMSLDDEDKKFLAFEQKKHIIKQNLRANKHVYLAKRGDDIVGYFRESGRPNNFSLLEEFVVFPQHRGNGYAKQMLEKYLELYPKSLAKTNAKNVKMINLLTQFGFKNDNGIRIINWIKE